MKTPQSTNQCSKFQMVAGCRLPQSHSPSPPIRAQARCKPDNVGYIVWHCRPLEEQCLKNATVLFKKGTQTSIAVHLQLQMRILFVGLFVCSSHCL